MYKYVIINSQDTLYLISVLSRVLPVTMAGQKAQLSLGKKRGVHCSSFRTYVLHNKYDRWNAVFWIELNIFSSLMFTSIQVAVNERPQQLTEAETKELEAKTEANIKIDKAKSQANIAETK